MFEDFTLQFVDAIRNPRRSVFVTRSCLEMTRSRIYGILADYEDQNDHDTLRHDTVFRIINGMPLDQTLASQTTHSRFENSVDIPPLNRLRDVSVDQVIDSFYAGLREWVLVVRGITPRWSLCVFLVPHSMTCFAIQPQKADRKSAPAEPADVFGSGLLSIHILEAVVEATFSSGASVRGLSKTHAD